MSEAGPDGAPHLRLGPLTPLSGSCALPVPTEGVGYLAIFSKNPAGRMGVTRAQVTVVHEPPELVSVRMRLIDSTSMLGRQGGEARFRALPDGLHLVSNQLEAGLAMTTPVGANLMFPAAVTQAQTWEMDAVLAATLKGIPQRSTMKQRFSVMGLRSMAMTTSGGSMPLLVIEESSTRRDETGTVVDVTVYRRHISPADGREMIRGVTRFVPISAAPGTAGPVVG